MSNRKRWVVLTALGLTVAACFDAGTSTPATPPLDPAKMQAYMSRNFTHIPNLTAALGRVIQAAQTGSAPGVTFQQTASGVTGTVLVDVKGDGTDSATVNANIHYLNPSVGILGGATSSTTITSANLSATASSTIGVTGGGSTVTFSGGAADLQYKSGPELVISSANLSVAMGTSLVTANSSAPISILGSADFQSGDKSGTIFFESNGAGGWRIRVVSPNFATFTVP